MSTTNEGTIDTRAKTLYEVMNRLIKPVNRALIDKLQDDSKADYINITTMKDLLDWACGHGRWRIEVVQVLPVIETMFIRKKGNERVPERGLLFGMIVRLWIQTEDQGWLYNDGTGTERLTGTPIFGDPLTNAYAQGVRRAAESFGMARELWRKKVIAAQLAAAATVKGGQDIPKAPPDHETAHVGTEPSRDINEDLHEGEDERADATPPAAAAPPPAEATPAAKKGGAVKKEAVKKEAAPAAAKKAAAAPPQNGQPLASKQQVDAISKLIRGKFGADPEEEANTHFGGRSLAELTEAEAGAWIAALNKAKATV